MTEVVREIWEALGLTAWFIAIAVIFFGLGYFLGATDNPRVVYIPKPVAADRPLIKQRAVIIENVKEPTQED